MDQEKDWKGIAQEIWDDYDNIALFLEQYIREKEPAEFHFLQKNLHRRFKYFNRYRSKTVTAEEYEKFTQSDKEFILSLLARHNKQNEP